MAMLPAPRRDPTRAFGLLRHYHMSERIFAAELAGKGLGCAEPPGAHLAPATMVRRQDSRTTEQMKQQCQVAFGVAGNQEVFPHVLVSMLAQPLSDGRRGGLKVASSMARALP